MPINNPILKIPTIYKKAEKKHGGGSDPTYFGNTGKFEQHKREIVGNLDEIINYSQKVKPAVSNPEKVNFFEMEFHEKAISKSAQPTELLDKSHIDVLSQVGDTKFIVSTKESNLKSFRDSTSKLSLSKDKKDSALLSAITKVEPLSKEDRISLDEFPEEGIYSAFMFFFDSLSESECKSIYKEISQESETDAEFFVTESGAKAIYGNFSKHFLETISEPHPQNPIQKIEKSLHFTVQQATKIQYDLSDIEVIDPEIDAKVAIVDSGISEHFLYNDLIIGVEDFIGDVDKTDLLHGTLVGSRAIFGNAIEEQLFTGKRLFANTRILDVRVMERTTDATGQTQCGVDDKKLVDAIKTVVEKYGDDVKVYNLSLNNTDYTCTHSRKRHYISRELDALAYKHKVIFIVSSGNSDVFLSEGYPECFDKPENVLTPPAEMLNGIAVGSLADIDSSRSIALNNELSPFSRVGLIGTKKPDLVHFGGNISKFRRIDGLGVKGLSQDQASILEDVGTSYSAPLVSQVTAKVYEYLKNSKEFDSEPIDLAKALVLHSGEYELPEQSRINSDSLQNLVGFGIPDYSRALDCIDSSVVYTFTDTLGEKIDKEAKLMKHKISFTVPNELVGKGKKVRVKGTLVYTPPTNSLGSLDYALSDIEVNLHYFNSKGTFQSGQLTSNNDDYRNRWNPVKSFERTFTAYSDGFWEVWLTLTSRGKADTDDFVQPYALVISLEDVSEEPVDLYQIIRTEHQEYISIEPQVRVQAS